MTTLFHLKQTLPKGLILFDGIEARAAAQELFRALTPNNERTVALIEPGPEPGFHAMDMIRKVASLDTAIVVAHPLWTQLATWDWTAAAAVTVHASRGEIVVRHQ